MRWVASPPPGAVPRRPAHRPARYTGPPAYPTPPRWGFPHVVWRSPTVVPGVPATGAPPMQRLRMVARNVTGLLWVLAGLAGVTAVGEGWRYALLIHSRTSALDRDVVGASDALVLAGSLLTFVMAVFAVVGALWWLFLARAAAAAEIGAEPPRPVWQVLVGTLLPGPNLVLAGSILAELEHAVLRRPVDQRPRPTRLVLWWWAAWVTNGLLLVTVIVWRMRDGVQAQADSVLLSGLLDLSAAALAALTAVVVGRFTLLLAPLDEVLSRGVRPWQVRGVTGAPRPPRPNRPTGSAR
ncbi:DUF4328 domain-containing protein [Amycolatopsis arida]|uniref:DUF4328 domain-containing protein n=1 Tax=Amycolatopsis arida TaxID=587909 RepID=UPI000B855AA2|nr:DUF4328 domain-containing protein [Amycolatopsis arida]